jgi:hypothetical protein
LCTRHKGIQKALENSRETPEAKAKREAREKEALRTEIEIAEATRLALIAERCGGVIPAQNVIVTTAPSLVVEEPSPVQDAPRRKATPTPPTPPTSESESDSESTDDDGYRMYDNEYETELATSLKGRLEAIDLEDTTPEEAMSAFNDDDAEVKKYLHDARNPLQAIRDLDFLYNQWIHERCTTQEMIYEANRIM